MSDNDRKYKAIRRTGSALGPQRCSRNCSGIARKPTGYGGGLLVVFAALLILGSDGIAADEKLRLRSGETTVVRIDEGPVAALTDDALNARFREDCRQAAFGNAYFLMLQFEELLTTSTRRALSASGVDLIEYIPDKAYLTRLPATTEISELVPLGLIGYYVPREKDKMPEYLYEYLVQARPGGDFEIRSEI